MKLNNFIAVLDACVLVPMPVADTLLRLAEEPAFYVPKWSAEILAELTRTLTAKLGASSEQAARRVKFMNEAFTEALVDGYENLVLAMTNDQKDRHVLAAAVSLRSTCDYHR